MASTTAALVTSVPSPAGKSGKEEGKKLSPWSRRANAHANSRCSNSACKGQGVLSPSRHKHLHALSTPCALESVFE
eukprot:6482538-Amphidinium_carterae.1